MEDIYSDIKSHFKKIDSAEVNEGRGAQGIKCNGKMFAMFYKGDLTLKFSPERVLKLIENNEAEPHDPGTGKPMKDRVLITAKNKDKWIKLAEESLIYNGGKL